MSNTTYPTTIDTPTNPSTNSTLATVPHHLQHGLENDAIVALETKLGTGTLLQTPTTNGFLVGTGAGASQWQPSPTSPSFTTSILDANNKTWIGQTPAGASAVNYLNISNSVTTVAPALSALGTDNNISLNLVPKGSGTVNDNGTPLIDFRSSYPNFVKSGGIWTIGSGLQGNATANVLFINGIEYTVVAISNHTFATSSDTYVDYTVGTGITYSAVANGAAAPALAANSVRLAKIITSGAAITSILQTGLDSLSNLIYPQNFVKSPQDANLWTAFHYPNRIEYTYTWAATAQSVGGNSNLSLGTITVPIGIINTGYIELTAIPLGGFGGRIYASFDNGGTTSPVTSFVLQLGNLTGGNISFTGLINITARTV